MEKTFQAKASSPELEITMACNNASIPAGQLTQDAAEAAVLCLINEERAATGADPLTLNLRLRAAARQHASDARTLKWWAGGGSQIHTNPVTGSEPADRIKGAGYCPGEAQPPMNENGFTAWYRGGDQSNTTPETAVTWWMNSPGHRDTLLDPIYGESGVGVVLGTAERGEGPDTADGGVIVVQTFGGCEMTEPATLGDVWSWGKNIGGQLGDGSTTDRHSPVHLKGVTGVIALSGGQAHTLALMNDASVLAWGFNPLGQLGDGTTTNRPTPGPVPSLADVRAVSAGNAHSLALLNDGTVMAWGANHEGQVGDGSTSNQSSPVQVVDLADGVAISAGFNHSLALDAGGRVWAWGANNFGQLGDGTTDSRSSPVAVGELRDVIAISAGFEHSLALTRDGTVWGWGSNIGGQMGNSNVFQHRTTPVRIQMPAPSGPIVAIAAGGFHNLALEQNGQVWAWGGNGYGQLGNGTTTDSPVPVRPFNVFEVTAISTGFGHSLVLKRDGNVWAWGMNSYGGQLGDGSTSDRSIPAPVVGLPFVVGIDAGPWHSLAT